MEETFYIEARAVLRSELEAGRAEKLLDVAIALMKGTQGNRAIAEAIFASEDAVKTNLNVLYGRLEARYGFLGDRPGRNATALLWQIVVKALRPTWQGEPLPETPAPPLKEPNFVPLREWLRSPDGLPKLLDPDWVGGVTWEDVVRGMVCPRAETAELLARLRADPAVLLMSARGGGASTAAAVCAHELHKEGWKVYMLNPRAAGFSTGQLMKEMLRGGGQRLFIFDSVHQHPAFYTALLEQVLAASDVSLRVLMLSLTRRRSRQRDDLSPRSPQDVSSPFYLRAPKHAMPDVLHHLCQLEQLEVTDEDVETACALYGSLWWARQAVTHSVSLGRKQLTVVPPDVLSRALYNRVFRPRLSTCDQEVHAWWTRLVAMGALGIETSPTWWSDVDAAEAACEALVQHDLVNREAGSAYLTIGSRDLCWGLLKADLSPEQPSPRQMQLATLRELVGLGKAPKLAFIFRILASPSGSHVGQQVVDVPTLMSLGQRLKHMEIAPALDVIDAFAGLDESRALALMTELGDDAIAEELWSNRYDAPRLANCLEILGRLDRPGIGAKVVERLSLPVGSSLSPEHSQPYLAEASYLGELAHTTKSLARLGYLLRAVARNHRGLASELAAVVSGRLFDPAADLYGSLRTAPAPQLMPLLRGLQFADPKRARVALRSVDRTHLVTTVAQLLGYGRLRPVFKVLWRVDSVYMTSLMSDLEDVIASDASRNWPTLRQLADDLDVISTAAPPLAARLANDIDNDVLKDLLRREPDAGTIGRALDSLDRANHVKAGLLLRDVGIAALAKIATNCPYAFPTGRYLRVLAEVELSIAKLVLKEVPLDVLAAKGSAQHLQLTGHGALIWGTASIDEARGRELHAVRWPTVNDRLPASLTLYDVSEGVSYLSEPFPDDAADFLRDRGASVRGLLDRHPSLSDLVTFIRALRRVAGSRPEVVESLLAGRDQWLSSRVRPDHDIATVGQYLSGLADVAPAAALQLLRRADVWAPVLQSASDVAASGKLALLVGAIAKADRATESGVLAAEPFASGLPAAIKSLAQRIAEQPGLGLTIRLMNALASIRKDFPEVVDDLVRTMGQTADLVETARGARHAEELAVFLSAVSRVAPAPQILVQTIVDSLGSFIVDLIARERLVWRLIWLNNSLTALEQDGLIAPSTLQGLWESPDLKMANVAARLVWERRLQVGASLLRQVWHEISEDAARRLALEACRQAETFPPFRQRAAAAGPVAAGALLLAVAECLGRESRPLRPLFEPHVQVIAGRAKKPTDLAFFALAVSHYDHPAAQVLIRSGQDRFDINPAEAALFAAAVGTTAMAGEMPGQGALADFVNDASNDVFERAIALRFWGAGFEQLAADNREILQEPDVPGGADQPGGLLAPVRPSQPLTVNDLRSQAWTIYDHYWLEPIRWLERIPTVELSGEVESAGRESEATGRAD